MSFVSYIIDIILHLDKYLSLIIQQFGVFAYLILFIIIFCETGLVIAPFLPGDSMIFVAGTFASVGAFNIWVLFFTFAIAAILGDTVNYWIGSFVGTRAFKENSKILKKEYLDKTHKFFEKYGSSAIILARFVPIVRTFAPFLAGVGKMTYWRFLAYNVVGGIGWVAIFVFGGYFFGNVPFVKDNLTLTVLIVIIVSFIPVATEYYRHKRKELKAQK